VTLKMHGENLKLMYYESSNYVYFTSYSYCVIKVKLRTMAGTGHLEVHEA